MWRKVRAVNSNVRTESSGTNNNNNNNSNNKYHIQQCTNMTHKCIENVCKWEQITEQLLDNERLTAMRRAVLITQSQLCFQVYEEVSGCCIRLLSGPTL